jgi:hypothetical protein
MDNAHYQMALRLYRQERWLGVPVIILTTIVGTAIFATLQQDTKVAWQIGTGLLSVAAATLAALQTFFNYGGAAQRNEEASTGYARIWRQLDQFQLRYAHESKATREDGLADLANLIKEMDDLEQKAPRVTNKVWRQIKNKSQSE